MQHKGNGKVALLIDGMGFLRCASGLDIKVDFRRFISYIESQRGYLVRAYFYATVTKPPDDRAMQDLLSWLSYNGFLVIAKQHKDFASNGSRSEANFAVELAVNAMELSQHVEEVVLCTSDEKFVNLIKALQRRGIRVIVVASRKTRSPPLSPELRRQADVFLELAELAPAIALEARS